MPVKLAFGMIVFNGNYVLKQCLESIYPFANQIMIAEGPVNYWQKQGFKTSTDGTNEVIDNFPDPEHKIQIIHSQYPEKGDQCNAYMKFLRDDNNYIWNVDCDEIFKPQDIETVIELLEQHKYTNVGFQSLSFFGGFDHYLTGFEENAEFLRICKVFPGARWKSHRPPRIDYDGQAMQNKHLNFISLANMGVRMYHYSYVFPRQVKEKVQYYKAAVSQSNCIDDYFNRVYLPWVTQPEKRESIEEEFSGVHEFKPSYRGQCRTQSFHGIHPQIILRDMEELKNAFERQIRRF